MGGFLTKLDVEQVEDTSNQGRGTWRLTKPLVYRSVFLSRILTVSSGFLTDFASVPRIPFVFDWLGDRGNLAATLHDWMYTAPHPVDTRYVADRVFLEALLDQGVPKLAAWFIYIGVRIGGAKHYD